MNTTAAHATVMASLQTLARQVDALATRGTHADARRRAMAAAGGVPQLPIPSPQSPRPGWVQQWRTHHYRRRLDRWQRSACMIFTPQVQIDHQH